jgi:hypothetical protein
MDHHALDSPAPSTSLQKALEAVPVEEHQPLQMEASSASVKDLRVVAIHHQTVASFVLLEDHQMAVVHRAVAMNYRVAVAMNHRVVG